MKNLREEYHRRICKKIVFVDDRGIPNNADKHSKLSVALAKGIVAQMKFPISGKRPSGQTSGKLFEEVTEGYLKKHLNNCNICGLATGFSALENTLKILSNTNIWQIYLKLFTHIKNSAQPLEIT